jgi:hypothetical protein
MTLQPFTDPGIPGTIPGVIREVAQEIRKANEAATLEILDAQTIEHAAELNAMRGELAGLRQQVNHLTGVTPRDETAAKAAKWDQIAALWHQYCAYVRGKTDLDVYWADDSRPLMRELTGDDNW